MAGQLPGGQACLLCCECQPVIEHEKLHKQSPSTIQFVTYTLQSVHARLTLSPHTPNTHTVTSYPDNIIITSTHQNADTAAQNSQPYLNTLHNWFTINRLQLAPTKSTMTLITNWNKEYHHVPHPTLNNTPLTHKHTSKIHRVTYNTVHHYHLHNISLTSKPS